MSMTRSAVLRILEEEDPQLHVAWNEQLQEIQMQLMGEVQIGDTEKYHF